MRFCCRGVNLLMILYRWLGQGDAIRVYVKLAVYGGK